MTTSTREARSVAVRCRFYGAVRRAKRAGRGDARRSHGVAVLMLGWAVVMSQATRAAWAASPVVTATAAGPALVVPGTTLGLNGIACPTATICEAVGATGNDLNNQGVVVPIINGVPGVAVKVPFTLFLLGVACSSVTVCEAVGEGPSAHEGVVVTITNGIPTDIHNVPGTLDLFGVACPMAATCEAVGVVDPSPNGVMVPIVNGVPGAAHLVPGTRSLSGVACLNAVSCEAVGGGLLANQGVVVPITNGVAAAAQVVSGGVLSGVACFDATRCEAVGSNSSHGVVVTILNSIPGAAQAISGSARPDGVACLDDRTCEVVGESSSVEGVVVPTMSGTPGAVQVVAGAAVLEGVACPNATTCEAVGLVSIADGQRHGVLVKISTIITVGVSGSQAVGSSSPSFSTATTPPPGDTFKGTLTCTSIGNPATAISPTLPAGIYTLVGSSCSGITLSGPTSSDYQIVYSGGTFTVNQASGATTTLARSSRAPGEQLPLTGETAASQRAAAGGVIIVVLGARQLLRRSES